MMKKTIVALLLLHMLSFAPPAAAVLGLGEKSVAWREEVTLRSGAPLLVDRSVTFGPDEWFRAGRGPMKQQTMSFKHAGRTIKWENLQGYAEVPAILDIVESAPVIVVAIGGWNNCLRYDFPRDGLVAWREERGKWARLDTAKLPPDLRVNLFASFTDLMRQPPAKGIVVNAAWKEQTGFRRESEGNDLATLSKRSAGGEQACAKLRPAPDPGLDAALRRVADAEKAAPIVIAARTALSTTTEQVSAAEVRATLGHWVTPAWVPEGCASMVKKVEARYSHTGDARTSRSELSGYMIELSAPGGGADVRVIVPGSQPQLARLACADGTLLVVRRASADKLLVDRFDAAGAIVDATWVGLPRAAEAAIEPNTWPTLWTLDIAGSELTVVLADYVYTRAMGQAGTLRRKATYTVALPQRP